MAKLVPVPHRDKPREPTNALGLTYLAEDFDAPLPPEIEAEFYGSK